jgi:alpha-amylase
MKKLFFLVSFLLVFVVFTSAQLTYRVKVPAATQACYIAGAFNSWTQQPMSRVNDSVFTLNVATATAASPYKYCSGPNWDYVEKAGNGSDIGDRTHTANDVVLRWAFVWYPDVAPLASANNNSDVMIQGFNWTSWTTTTGWYNTVATKAVEMKNAGINVIWMPPPSDATSNEGYLPRQLYLFNSRYGSEQQLISCINTLHTNNIKVLADIVINHRVGTTNWGDFTNPTWGCWAVTADDEWAANAGNPCGAFDTGESFLGGRDLDHTNSTVRRDLIAWMRHLKTTIGFDGWRHDYAKGFPPAYFQMSNDSTQPYISVGEFFDADTARVRNWLNGTAMKSAAFDFPLKFTLGTAVSGNYTVLSNAGKANGLIGAAPCNAVTFLDNHDTYRTTGQNFPTTKILEGYAYLFTHPGMPMIFWDHYFDVAANKTAINTLINVRRSNNITCSSVLNIQQASTNEYAAIIDNKVAVRLGTGTWIPAGSGWTVKATGTNYMVWDRGSLPVTLSSVSASWANVKDVVVKWTTLTEVNAGYFDVERSIDGLAFKAIGTVRATGNSTESKHYSLTNTDVNKSYRTKPDVYYYRVKMVDNDGKYSYSSVVRVINLRNRSFSLSPNPVKSRLYIQGLNSSKTYSITITNAAGASKNLLLKAGTNQVDVSNLPAGAYFLNMEGQSKKFVKLD